MKIKVFILIALLCCCFNANILSFASSGIPVETISEVEDKKLSNRLDEKSRLSISSAPSGIAGNGTGGIYIDINAAPYTTFSKIATWGKYAYTNQGCAWFASARVNQLTGKGNMIYSGQSWWNSQGTAMGFSKGSTIRSKALACYSGHVAVIEKVEGDTVIVSEGGYNWSGYNGPAHGYTIIHQTTVHGVENRSGDTFLGYVYLDGTNVDLGNIFSNVYTENVSDTEAVLWGVLNRVYTVSEVGCYVGTSTDQMTRISEVPTYKKVDKMWYSMQKWYGVLQRGTTYYYQIYAVIGGKEYRSDVHSFTTTGDSVPPQISNVRVIERTGSSYTVVCTANDDQGVARVQFPSWGDVNGQNDLYSGWETNPAASGAWNGTEFVYTVRMSDHGNETGSYTTHIYAFDHSGNRSPVGGVVVEINPLTGISLSNESKMLKKGERFQLSVGYQPENTTEQNKTVSWNSSNSTVATVENGVVTGLVEGSTVITAVLGDKTASCTVTVEEDPVIPDQPDTPNQPEIPDFPWIFIDVLQRPGEWKYEAVKYVHEREIMSGVGGSNEFQPHQPLTRAMFATVLYRAAGEPSVTFTNKFTDVEAGRWYSDAVIWASENQIVSGFATGAYGIHYNITREQIAKMLYLYGECKGYDVSARASLEAFTDCTELKEWSVEYMQWAVNTGMISGKHNGDTTYRLDPRGPATRAECAKMLAMFLQKYE